LRDCVNEPRKSLRRRRENASRPTTKRKSGNDRRKKRKSGASVRRRSAENERKRSEPRLRKKRKELQRRGEPRPRQTVWSVRKLLGNKCNERKKPLLDLRPAKQQKESLLTAWLLLLLFMSQLPLNLAVLEAMSLLICVKVLHLARRRLLATFLLATSRLVTTHLAISRLATIHLAISRLVITQLAISPLEIFLCGTHQPRPLMAQLVDDMCLCT
jgi:hypothetical protein